MIACIGWGSLIWSPRALPIRRGWFPDGPELPIEFARQARDGRITLVLTPGASPLRSLWAELSSSDVAGAREALRRREGIPADRADDHVGWWSPDGHSDGMCVDVIAAWAASLGIGSVVWTALPPGFRRSRGEVPVADTLVRYLNDLPPGERRVAEEYVRRAPAQIETAYRAVFQRELGWTPISTES